FVGALDAGGADVSIQSGGSTSDVYLESTLTSTGGAVSISAGRNVRFYTSGSGLSTGSGSGSVALTATAGYVTEEVSGPTITTGSLTATANDNYNVNLPN